MSDLLTKQINFGVTEAQFLEAQQIERDTGLKPTQLARAGFASELKRYQARSTGPVDVETLRLVAEATRLGVDVPGLLKTALTSVT